MAVESIGIVMTVQDRLRPFVGIIGELNRKRYVVQVFASPAAERHLKDRGVQDIIPFTADKQGFEPLLKRCSKCSVVLTGAIDPFSRSVQKTLKDKCPAITRLVCYDRHDPCEELPEKERKTALEILPLATRVLFVNAGLATESHHIPFGHSVIFSQVETLSEKKNRQNAAKKLAALLKERGIDPRGKQIFTYCGSSGDEYCTRAFPHFLACLKEMDLTNRIVLLWLDPKANELDLNQIPKELHKHILLLSDLSQISKKLRSRMFPRPENWSAYEAVAAISNGALLTFDAAITAAALLAGYPTIQVAPSRDAPDLGLDKRPFPLACKPEDLARLISAPLSPSEETQASLRTQWGLRSDWAQQLILALTGPRGQKRKEKA